MEAGGRDVIGPNGKWDSFGLGEVNSSIGSQWRSISPEFRRILERLPPSQPIQFTFNF